MAQEKPNLGPNLDFFSVEELEALITKFQEERGNISSSTSNNNESRISRFSARSSASMSELFERNLGVGKR